MIEYPCQLRNCVHCKPVDTDKINVNGSPFCYLCSEFVGFSLFKVNDDDEKPPWDFSSNLPPHVVIDPDAEIHADEVGGNAITNENFNAVIDENEGAWKCAVCGKGFGSKGLRLSHMKKSHHGR